MNEGRESSSGGGKGFLLAPSGSSRRKSATYLFKYLLCANFLQYIEAGAVPALLLQLASSFKMSTGQQGLLGGIVYLSLSAGGPFAGYILRHFEHKTVVLSALCINTLFTLAWALTPTNLRHSSSLFIAIRFLMGLSQCVLCVFLPLWTNEYAPKGKRTSYMSRLQASVPFGVMAGYILASVVLTLSKGSDTCGPMLCWRIPFLFEVLLTIPFCIALHFVPAEHVSIKVVHNNTKKAMRRTTSNAQLLQIYKEHDTSGDITSTSAISSTKAGKGVSTPGSNVNFNNTGSSAADVVSPITCLMNSEYDLAKGKKTPNSPLQLNGVAPAIGAANIMSSAQKAGGNGDNSSCNGSSNNDDGDTNDNDTAGTAAGNAIVVEASSSGGEGSQQGRAGQLAIDIADTVFASDCDMLPDGSTNFLDIDNSSSRDASEAEAGYRDKSPMVTSRRGRSERSKLRQQSVSASIFSAVSARDIIRKSYDDLRSLDSSDDLLFMLPGIQYGIEPHRSPHRQRSAIPEEGVGLVSHSRGEGSKESSPSSGTARDDVADRDAHVSDTSPDISRISPATSPTPTPTHRPSTQASSLLAKSRASTFRAGEGDDIGYGSLHSATSPVSRPQYRWAAARTAGYESLRDALKETRLATGTTAHKSRRHERPGSKHPGLGKGQRGGGSEAGSPSCVDVSRLGIDDANNNNNNNMALNNSTSNYVIESDSSGSSGSNDDDEYFSPAKGSHVMSIDNADGNGSPTNRSMASSAMVLLRIPVYRHILGAMAALYFTVTGVQFWGTSYLHVALKAPLPLVNTLFILCAATGPTLGVFFGGWLVDFCGGYRGVKQRTVALEICCFFGIISCVFSIPITFLNNIESVVVLLWLVLFSGAAILPACSGILVSIVPRKHRAVSSSLSLVVFNLFGYCLSLLLSGYLMQWLQHFDIACGMACELTWGFRLVLFWSNFSLIFLVLALVSSYEERERKERRRLSYFLDA